MLAPAIVPAVMTAALPVVTPVEPSMLILFWAVRLAPATTETVLAEAFNVMPPPDAVMPPAVSAETFVVAA